MKNTYLVGFMGTGKTSVGKAVSQSLKRSFVEMDAQIEEREKTAISDIFATKGEPYFRMVEQALLKTLSSQHDLIVSCGGGIVLNPDNIRCMKESGILICLTATPECIFERVRHTTHRPLLQVHDPLNRIRALLKERQPLYEQADFLIDTTSLQEQEVVERVLDIVRNVNRR